MYVYMAGSLLLTERSRGHDLHGNLGRGRDGVVGVGEEARVHAAVEGLAGGVKGRLGDGVVLGQELEHDGVADGDVERVGLVDEATGPADLDGVARAGGGHGRGLALADGGGGTAGDGDDGGIVLAGGDGAGDGDLLVDGGGLRVVTRVGPDDDDFGARVDGDAASLHAAEESDGAAVELGLHGGARVGAHGVDAAKSAARGHCERRDGHGDGC